MEQLHTRWLDRVGFDLLQSTDLHRCLALQQVRLQWNSFELLGGLQARQRCSHPLRRAKLRGYVGAILNSWRDPIPDVAEQHTQACDDSKDDGKGNEPFHHVPKQITLFHGLRYALITHWAITALGAVSVLVAAVHDVFFLNGGKQC